VLTFLCCKNQMLNPPDYILHPLSFSSRRCFFLQKWQWYCI
jgi:hypothetical protein